MFEEALKTEVAGVTGLTSKVFPINAPEGTVPPYVTYEAGGYNFDKVLEGYLTSGTIRATLEVVESTAAKAIALAVLVKAEIRGWLGTTMATTGPAIQDVTIDDESDVLYDPQTGRYIIVIGFEVRL